MLASTSPDLTSSMRVTFSLIKAEKNPPIQTNPSRFDGLEGIHGDARGYTCFSTKVKLHEYIVIVLIQIF